jgi:hypothetical protein
MPPAPNRRPAPVRDEKEALSTGRGKKKKTSVVSKSWDAEVPRLTDAELRSIPRPELLGLIQDLALPEFLAKHQIVGTPAALSAKLNKENILAIYNLLFDSGSRQPPSLLALLVLYWYKSRQVQLLTLTTCSSTVAAGNQQVYLLYWCFTRVQKYKC